MQQLLYALHQDAGLAYNTVLKCSEHFLVVRILPIAKDRAVFALAYAPTASLLG